MNTHRTRTAAGAMLRLAPVCLISGTALAQSPPPGTIELTAVVRDFKEWSVSSGHPDFERNKALSLGGVTEGAVKLNSDRKLDFLGGTKLVRTGSTYKQWKDSAGRPISMYMATKYPRPGDVAGALDPKAKSAFTTAANFNEWYNDVPGVNMSMPVKLTLKLQPGGSYLFDSATDAPYKSKGGFFPIDGLLLGNSKANPAHNFHFTTEIHATFIYSSTGGQILEFTGDDDVWVFINGEPVVELGGTHSPVAEYVDLSRLGLVNGKTYLIDLFHAERQTDGSNFRFQANFIMKDVEKTPQITASVD